MQLTPQGVPLFFWLLSMNMKILSKYSLSKFRNNVQCTMAIIAIICRNGAQTHFVDADGSTAFHLSAGSQNYK